MADPSSKPDSPARGASFRLETAAGLCSGLLIVSNLASTRMVELGPFSFDGGTLVFPLTYVLGDLMTEVYGYARSRAVIWTAFLCLGLAFLCLHLVSLLPAPEGWEGAEAWNSILGLSPRIALGSLAAFLAGSLVNAAVLSKMKTRNPGGPPAWRFVASTLAGEAVDTLAFAAVAFLGVISGTLWLELAVSNFVYKTGFEIVLLPLTLLLARRLKKAEGADPVDEGVSLSPFPWSFRRRGGGENGGGAVG
ncbi:MAG: queuosine precursor transporter [Deltaproteobacteria bacterium]|jgi:uncharacterized integral membrane protein (TIGR00697 family)|nr:queuosine precursor transporter [Deltaproteobacteria bacterium]